MHLISVFYPILLRESTDYGTYHYSIHVDNVESMDTSSVVKSKPSPSSSMLSEVDVHSETGMYSEIGICIGLNTGCGV
jgi:hypothetical protein